MPNPVVHYDYFVYTVQKSENVQSIAEKFSDPHDPITEDQIYEHNPDVISPGQQPKQGDKLIIPPGKNTEEKLMNGESVYSSLFFERNRLMLEMARNIAHRLVINSLLLEEVKKTEYRAKVGAVDAAVTITPGVGQVKAVVDLVLGKNVVKYIAYEVRKGQPVPNLSGLDRTQAFVSIVSGSTMVPQVRSFLSAGEILFIQIVGNVNDVVSAERTVTEELNRETGGN